MLLRCHAGCHAGDITAALGLTVRDLFADSPPARAQAVAVYDYRDDAGKLLAQKLRYPDKRFTWRRPAGGGQWVYDRKGLPNRLYVAGELGGLVHIVEGEKDADSFHAQLGGCAVSGADGAGPGKWRREYTEQLRDLPVVILPDNDAVGRAFAQETAAATCWRPRGRGRRPGCCWSWSGRPRSGSRPACPRRSPTRCSPCSKA